MNEAIMTAQISKMYVDGYMRSRARWWLNVKEAARQSEDYTPEQKRWAIKHGFTPSVVERYGINDQNVDDFVSLRDHVFIYPINDIFKKWLTDRVTTRKVLKPFKDHLLDFIFHIYMRDGEPLVVKLDDCPEGAEDTMDGVLKLLQTDGPLHLMKTYGLDYRTLEYVGPADGSYGMDELSAEAMQVVNGMFVIEEDMRGKKQKYWMNSMAEMLAKIDDNLLFARYRMDGEEMSGGLLACKLFAMCASHVRVLVKIPEASGVMDFGGGEDNMTVVRTIVVNEFGDNPEMKQAYIRVARGEEDWELELTEYKNEKELEQSTGRTMKDFTISKVISDIDSDHFGYSDLEDERINPGWLIKSARVRNVYAPVDVATGEFDGAVQVDDTNTIIHLPESLDNGKPFKGVVPHWEEIKQTLVEIGHFIPQIEIMEVDVLVTKDGFVFADFNDHPFYPQAVGFNEEMTRYLKMKVKQAHEDKGNLQRARKMFQKGADGFFWSNFTKVVAPPKMRPLIFKWWYKTTFHDFFSNNGMTLEQKRWAYQKGFLSYRIKQYGLNEDNYKDYISDYDYRYLRHINNKYRVWLEDKITVKYICSDFPEFFPEYYYHVSVRNGQKRVIPLMDLPKDCDASLDGVFELAKRKGALACKPQRGSQGEGFYKLSYEDGQFYMNHEPATKDEILKILDDPEAQYLITEYIQQHPVINEIYPGSVNTMRIISFMRDGKTPQIGNAYMRFGSEATGAVDNMGAGGMTVELDEKTGHFYNGMLIKDNTIIPIDNHPDTGVSLEGDIPHWDRIIEGIKQLHLAMPELEYLGFDVAVTEDGMKLPEINRAPGLPKIESLNRETIDYLLYKKKKKMESVGIAKTKF